MEYVWPGSNPRNSCPALTGREAVGFNSTGQPKRETLIVDIDEKTFARIAELIQSDESPVGIDAKKTHVLILHKLNEIEKRLRTLENWISNRGN